MNTNRLIITSMIEINTLIVITLHTSIYISRTLNSGDASGSSTEDLDDI